MLNLAARQKNAGKKVDNFFSMEARGDKPLADLMANRHAS